MHALPERETGYSRPMGLPILMTPWLKLVPPPGTDPESPPYQSGARPLCYEGVAGGLGFEPNAMRHHLFSKQRR